MPSVTLAELQAFAERRAGAEHDDYSRAGLARALEEFRAVGRRPIAPVRVAVGGTAYPSFFAALEDPGATFADAELTVVDPPPAGPAWEWARPTRRLVLHPDGAVDVHPLDDGPPLRTIGRLLRRDHYVPRSEAATLAVAPEPRADPRPGLLAVAPAVRLVRAAGFVPFAIALLLYGPDERYRYELDLVDGTLLADPRAGTLPVARRVRRTSRVAHEVDAFLARWELSVGNARVLEALVDSHGLAPFEVARIVGGVRESGTSALRTLAARGLATLDRQTGVYRPRFDAFRPERGAPGARAPMPNPALRTSVMELLAAADSRATCPLCGDPLPVGPRGILCPRCQAEVGETGPEAPR